MSVLKKRSICILLAGLIGVMGSVGCVKSSAPTSSETKAETKVETKEETKVTETKVTDKEREVITMWHWDASYGDYIKPEFEKNFPDIELNFVVVNHPDYMQKLQSAIAAGMDVPDIIAGETAFRGKIFDLGILDNLEAAPYNLKREEMFEYAVSGMSNAKGEIVGVDTGITPAGWAYKRDLAKEYLGTDDPEELEKMLPDWDSVIKIGKEVKAKSGGKVFMQSSIGDPMYALRNQNAKDYISGEEIDITARFGGFLDQVIEIRDAGITNNIELWTPGWNTTFADNSVIFFNFAPWSAKWHVKANDPDGSGNWGLMKAPDGGFTMGGTSVSIYKDSKHKEAAWEFIQFAFYGIEGCKYVFDQAGEYPPYKPFYDKYQDVTKQGVHDEFFGGQAIGEIFVNKIVPECVSQQQTKYESIVDESYHKLEPLLMKDKSIKTGQEALQKLIEEVKIKAPKATVK